MNILLVYNEGGAGSNFYRLEMPHHHLGENYPEYKFWSVGDINEIEDFSKYAAVIFSRGIDYKGKSKEIAERIKPHCKIVLDLDDYWQLGKGHILFEEWKRNKTPDNIRDGIQLADHIICTTKYLSKSVKGINRNTVVIPNAVFPEVYKQFQCRPIERTKELRLGWIGGSCHVEDMELLYELGEWNAKEQPDICFHVVNDMVEGGVYDYYRMLVTHNGARDNYMAIPTTDVYSYGMNYNLLDVALAPLKDTEFNTKKSELKVIEAGFHKKALIVSAVKPYTDICNSKNSILCTTGKDWINAVKRLLNEPNLVEDLGNQLFIDVQKFHIAEVNKKRDGFYKSICTKEPDIHL